MTYFGHVKDGKVVLDQEVELPEGVPVRLELLSLDVDQSPISDSSEVPSPPLVASGTMWDRMLEFAGSVDGPADWASNHDHYIHGTPKRQ